MPLVEVSRLSDSGESGSFADLRCVGRARIVELQRDGRAVVNPFRDADSDADADADGDGACDAKRVQEVHDECHVLHRELARLHRPEEAMWSQPAREAAASMSARFHRILLDDDSVDDDDASEEEELGFRAFRVSPEKTAAPVLKMRPKKSRS